MAAPATSQSLQPNSASNLVPASVIASAEPSAAAEPLLTLLLENEDAAAYDEIIARISAAVKPADFLEEIWVRDVVALFWEAFRLRRLKMCLTGTAAHHGLARVLSSFLPRTAVNEIAAGWARRDGECVKQVEGLLDQTGLTMERVIAETLTDRIDDIERIDRMIASAEQRRGAILAKRNTPKKHRRINRLRAHPKTHRLTPPRSAPHHTRRQSGLAQRGTPPCR